MNTDYNKTSEIWFTRFAAPQALTEDDNIDNEVIIRLTEEAVKEMQSVDDIHKILGEQYTVIEAMGLPGMFLAKVNNNADIEILNNSSKISYAIKNEEVDIDNVLDRTPNDPSYSIGTRLWGLNSPNFGINVENVWDRGVGSSNVLIVVSDTGIDINHVDLSANIGATSTSTAAGNHGTHVAGTIGGVGNNGTGIAGVNWNVSLINEPSIATINGARPTSATMAISVNRIAARAANGENIRAANFSWRIDTPNAAYYPLLQAFQALDNEGVIICASAGNGYSNNDPLERLPSCYCSQNSRNLILDSMGRIRLNNMIVVAAHDINGNHCVFSNWSATLVDITAPGEGIYSSVVNNGYDTYRGTSMSTPHVCGAIGLLSSIFPNATNAQIRNAIFNSTLPMDQQTSTGLSRPIMRGRLNVSGAAALLGGGTSPPANNTVTVSNLDFNLVEANNHPSAGCGTNLTPTLTWDVSYQGNCNNSNTTFDVRMIDTNAGNSVHWNISNIAGSARSIGSGNLQGGTIVTTSWPSQQNADGYAGPFPPAGSKHNYNIVITASSTAGTSNSDNHSEQNFECLPPTVTVKDIQWELKRENNHPDFAIGCGDNDTPGISWDVEYQGAVDDSDIFFTVRIYSGSRWHWYIEAINGTTRSVGSGNLGGGTATRQLSRANNDGYTGPYLPGLNSYTVEILPVSKGKAFNSSPAESAKSNFNNCSAPPPPTPTITPTPTSTPPAPTPTPTPTSTPARNYSNSSLDLYVSDSAGNVYAVDIRDKRNPQVIKKSDGNIVRLTSHRGHRSLLVTRSKDTHYYDYFWTTNYYDGGFKSGYLYSDKTTDTVNNMACTNDLTLSYLIIKLNQKVINLQHWFRDDSNIRLSFDTNTSGSASRWLQLDNVSVCPLKKDTDGYAREFLLSTTTSIPDYIAYQGWYVTCPTDSTKNRYFDTEANAEAYKNTIISEGCTSAVFRGGTYKNPIYTSLPTAFVLNDRQDIYLRIEPKRGTAAGGGKRIANAYRPSLTMNSAIEYKESDRQDYILYSAGYNIAKDIVNIPDETAGGLGRTRGTYAPCANREDIGLMSRTRLPGASSSFYNSAIKTIAGKYQTIAIDSNGDAYYTGNSNYGPFSAGTVIPLSASGGEKTVVGDYTIHTFKQNGTFNITSLPVGSKFDILVVGGGGGGGYHAKASGGGGGGAATHQQDTEFPSTGSYNITIGNGGGSQRNGENSSIKSSGGFDMTANGGGGAISLNGGASGSGLSGGLHKGGGSYIAAGGGGGANGLGIGGDGNLAWDPTQGSGPAYHLKGGDGGLPYETDISGTTQWYGGGGGGSMENVGNQVYYLRGVGGGGRTNDKGRTLTGIIYNPGRAVSNPNWATRFYTGAANNTPAIGNGGGGGQGYKQGRSSYPATGQTAGTPNTGGGGGGPSAAGGSGIVIIRYKTNQTGGGSGDLDRMRRIVPYVSVPSLQPNTVDNTLRERTVNFVDAAIMSYNHQGMDKSDKSTYTVFLLDDKGSLWTFGYSPDDNHKFYCLPYDGKIIEGSASPPSTFPNDNISSISAGADHAMFIRHGKIYAIGSNTRGQLASPETISYIPNFTRISGGGRIKKVVCGAYHTMILNTEGRAWSAGDNTCGQLGVGLNPNLSIANHKSHTWKEIIIGNRPIKDIFSSRVADHYLYQTPCTTNGRTRRCGAGEDPNKAPVRSKYNCGCVTDPGYMYVWGDRTYGQSGNLLSSTYNSSAATGPYVADGTMMISPVYVPFFYTAFRGSTQKNSSVIDSIPSGYSYMVRSGYFINMNFLYTSTQSNSTYNTSLKTTTFTVGSAAGVLTGMWVQIGDLRAWGTATNKGQVKSVSGNTVTVYGNYPINDKTSVVFKLFKQNTRITSVEINTDGTLKATVNTPAGATQSYSSTDAKSIVYSYYYLRPEKIAAAKDGVYIIDNAKRFIRWGVDKGYNACSTIDRPTRIPLLVLNTGKNNDHIDVSCGLDHITVLRKLMPPQ